MAPVEESKKKKKTYGSVLARLAKNNLILATFLLLPKTGLEHGVFAPQVAGSGIAISGKEEEQLYLF